MSRLKLSCALAAVAALSHGGIAAQSTPDFAGNWALESPAQHSDLPPVLYVRRQAGAPESIFIEREYSARIERARHQFSAESVPVAGPARTFQLATWEGTTLVLTQGAYARNSAEARDWERREEWSLGQSGSLNVTISISGPRVDARKVTARYRRLTLRPVDDPEAYAVYSSLLPQEWLVRVAHAKVLVFQSETTTYNECLPKGKALEGEWREVLDNYRAENAAPRVLVAGKNLVLPYQVIPRRQIDAAFQKQQPNDMSFGWTGFHTRYPEAHGYMQLSAVGFDASKMRALVYLSHHCGGLCGGGQHHLLEKVNGAWRPAQLPDVTMCMWVS
jgi:hypothetical protein